MKLLLVSLILISAPVHASRYHWYNKTGPGTAHFWDNGTKIGSSHYWNNGTKAGSSYFWNNGTEYGSKHFWDNSTAPGSRYYWKNGTGPGSEYFFKNKTGQGSLHYWNNGTDISFEPIFISLCKGGAIDIPPCELYTLHSFDPNKIIDMINNYQCDDVEGRAGMKPGTINSLINSLPNSH